MCDIFIPLYKLRASKARLPLISFDPVKYTFGRSCFNEVLPQAMRHACALQLREFNEKLEDDLAYHLRGLQTFARVGDRLGFWPFVQEPERVLSNRSIGQGAFFCFLGDAVEIFKREKVIELLTACLANEAFNWLDTEGQGDHSHRRSSLSLAFPCLPYQPASNPGPTPSMDVLSDTGPQTCLYQPVSSALITPSEPPSLEFSSKHKVRSSYPPSASVSAPSASAHSTLVRPKVTRSSLPGRVPSSGPVLERPLSGMPRPTTRQTRSAFSVSTLSSGPSAGPSEDATVHPKPAVKTTTMTSLLPDSLRAQAANGVVRHLVSRPPAAPVHPLTRRFTGTEAQEETESPMDVDFGPAHPFPATPAARLAVDPSSTALTPFVDALMRSPALVETVPVAQSLLVPGPSSSGAIAQKHQPLNPAAVSRIPKRGRPVKEEPHAQEPLAKRARYQEPRKIARRKT